MAGYDTTEARELLTRFADEADPDARVEAQSEAARALVAALAGLHGHAHMSWVSDGGVVKVSMPHVGDAIIFAQVGEIVVQGPPGKGAYKTIPLRFDPVSRQLESRMDDPRSLAPGELPRKRSAVTEVVERVIQVLRAQARTDEQ